jgi:hypothetical protein
MSNLENLKKQAKQYLRWHRERYYPMRRFWRQISSWLMRKSWLRERRDLRDGRRSGLEPTPWFNQRNKTPFHQ